MADQPTAAEKPSFFRSTMSGIAGFIKGGLAGGAVGALGGAALGAIAEAVAVVVMAPAAITLASFAAVPAVAIMGAVAGAAVLGGIGTIAGTTTGVVRSRETSQPSADDIANVAKISMVQGMAIEHARSQHQEQSHEVSSKWQNAENTRITARAAVQQTTLG